MAKSVAMAGCEDKLKAGVHLRLDTPGCEDKLKPAALLRLVMNLSLWRDRS